MKTWVKDTTQRPSLLKELSFGMEITSAYECRYFSRLVRCGRKNAPGQETQSIDNKQGGKVRDQGITANFLFQVPHGIPQLCPLQ